MLRERLKGRSLRFSDRERVLLARKAFGIPRKTLLELGTIVIPDTLLRWHRRLIAQKFTCGHRNPGRPRTMRIIAELIVRMVLENPRWGYTRIQGALLNVGHEVDASPLLTCSGARASSRHLTEARGRSGRCFPNSSAVVWLSPP